MTDKKKMYVVICICQYSIKSRNINDIVNTFYIKTQWLKMSVSGGKWLFV